MHHPRLAWFVGTALTLAACARPTPDRVIEAPPTQPRADPLALIDADASEVRAEVYVELDGAWPAELVFVTGARDEHPDAGSDVSLHVYGFDGSGTPQKLHSDTTSVRDLVPVLADPDSGRHVLALRGRRFDEPDTLSGILELDDGGVRDARWVTGPGDAFIPFDEDGAGAHELLVVTGRTFGKYEPVYVLARDPADGFWKGRAPMAPASRWIESAWSAYTAQDLGSDARFVFPALLNAAHEAGVTLELGAELRGQTREAFEASPDRRERFGLLYALMGTKDAGDVDALRDAIKPEDGLEVTLVWHAFALEADNTKARRDAFVATLESGLDMTWNDDNADLGPLHRLTGAITQAFAQAKDDRVLTYLRARPNTRYELAEGFSPAWRSEAMLEDLSTRAPSAPQVLRALLAFAGHEPEGAKSLVATFATPARRAQLGAWLDMNDTRILHTLCQAYRVAEDPKTPCTEARVLAAAEASIARDDVTHALHLLDYLPAAPTTTDARTRYAALAAHPRMDSRGRHEIGRRLLAKDDVDARLDLLLDLHPYYWCGAVDASLRPAIEEMPSAQRKDAFTLALAKLHSKDPFNGLTLMSCFDGFDEAKTLHTPGQKNEALTRALDPVNDLDPFQLLRWDPDAFSSSASAYLDGCIQRLSDGEVAPSYEQCGNMLTVAPYTYDEARSKRLNELLRALEEPLPQGDYACYAWRTAATLSLLQWDAHTEAFLARERPAAFVEACGAGLYREAYDALALVRTAPGPRRDALRAWARTHPWVEVRTLAIRLE